MKRITLPISKKDIKDLKAGQEILLSGTIFTARDAAHKRMIESISMGQALPFDVAGAVIYYAGPTPAKPGRVIGSCGPTTSVRMDAYAPILYDMGLSIVIGKGDVGKEVKQSIQRNGSCYLAATGGAGALYGACVKSIKVIGYDELGPESVKELTVKDMPLIVAVTAQDDIYNIED